MSVTLEESETSSSPTRRIVIGWLLIGTAFLVSIGMAIKADDAYAAGEKIGRLFGTWLFMAFLAWAVTHSRSRAAKANARIIVGVILLLSIGMGISNGAKEKEIGRKFLQDGLALNQQHEKRFEQLGERFEKADMSNVLAPESVTTAAGIASSRALVAQYRTLIAERGALLKRNLEEAQSLVFHLPPSEVKTGAEDGAAKKIKETSDMFKDLDRAELAQLASIEKLLDWCAAQGRQLGSEQGQFRFTSEAQLIQFRALLDELKSHELEVGYASKAVQQKAARFTAKKAEDLKKVKEIFAD
jgi:hypothetical protein